VVKTPSPITYREKGVSHCMLHIKTMYMKVHTLFKKLTIIANAQIVSLLLLKLKSHEKIDTGMTSLTLTDVIVS
jgi:hypothetical protein